MVIFPKGYDIKEENDCLSKYVNKYKGIEIQMIEDLNYPRRIGYDIKACVKRAIEQFPGINEVIIHIPIKDCYLENIATLNPDRLLDEMLSAVDAADKYKIHVNVLYHTSISYQVITKTLEDIIYKMLSIIRRHEVTILIENSVHYSGRICPPLVLCSEINHPQLKACIDTTHLKCQANIYKEDPHNWMNEILSFLGPKELNNIVKVIHFAQAINNDGYINHETHGRRHESGEELEKDIAVLRTCGIKNAIFVTEVSEEDYYTRPDQLWEIKELEKV